MTNKNFFSDITVAVSYFTNIKKQKHRIEILSFENPVKKQESISWVLNRLDCNSYYGKNGQLIFSFKNYLTNYIQSIDPNFDEDDIEQARYITADVDERYAESAGASILTKSAKASSELQKILHDRSTSDMFPGKFMIRFQYFTKNLRVEFRWT